MYLCLYFAKRCKVGAKLGAREVLRGCVEGTKGVQREYKGGGEGGLRIIFKILKVQPKLS